jgi:hypothetical protein
MLLWLSAIGAAAVIWYLFRPPKPIQYRGRRLENLPEFFHGLIVGVSAGGILYARHEGSPQFLQFRKDLLPSGDRRLHFGFPNAPWSRDSYPRLRELLASAGIDFAERSTGEEAVPCFLLVDGLTQTEAYRVAELACQAMGMGRDATFTVSFAGVPSASEFRAFVREGRGGRF